MPVAPSVILGSTVCGFPGLVLPELVVVRLSLHLPVLGLQPRSKHCVVFIIVLLALSVTTAVLPLHEYEVFPETTGFEITPAGLVG